MYDDVLSHSQSLNHINRRESNEYVKALVAVWDVNSLSQTVVALWKSCCHFHKKSMLYVIYIYIYSRRNVNGTNSSCWRSGSVWV